MTAVLVVGAIAVIGAVVARVTWRRPADERHSIQSHQQTLDTLRAMSDRRQTSPADRASVARSDSPASAPPRTRTGPAHAAPTRAAPAHGAPVRAKGHGANGLDELVFDDTASARSGEFPRPSPLTLPGGSTRPGLGRRRHGSSRRRSTPLLPLAGAVVVLAAVVGAAVALSPSHPPKRLTAVHRPSTKSKSSSTTVAPTTVPPPQVHASSSTSTTADYGAPATSYTVALRATGPCWVEATTASTGNVVWTGTMTPGQSRSVPATGSLILRLGAPQDVTVTLNGTPVVLPTGYQSPFDMRFTSA